MPFSVSRLRSELKQLSKQAEVSLEPPSEEAPSEPQGRTSPREDLSNNAEEKSAHYIGCDPALDTGRERDEGLSTSDEDSDEDRSTPSDPEEQTRSEEASDEWPNPAEAQMLTAPTEPSEPAPEPLSVEASCVVEGVPRELGHVEPRVPSAPASPSNLGALVARVEGEFVEAEPKELGHVEPPTPSAPASPSNPGALVARIEVELLAEPQVLVPTSSVDACVQWSTLAAALLEPAGPSKLTAAESFVPTEDLTCKLALPEPIEPLPSVEERALDEPTDEPSERVAVEPEAMHSSEEGPALRELSELTVYLVSTEGQAPCELQASEPVSVASVLLEACGYTLAGPPTACLVPETKSSEPLICEARAPVQPLATEVAEEALPVEPQAADQDRPSESEVEGTQNEPAVEMSEPSAKLELGMEIEPVIEESKDLPNQGKSCGSIEEEESTTQPAPTISIEAENCSGDTEEAIRTEADYVTVEQPIAFDGELEDRVELRAGSVREADKVQEEIAAAFGEITVETPNTTINNDKEKKTDEEKLEEEHEKQESSGEGMQNEHTIEEKTTEENEERKEESDKDRMDIEVAPQGEEEANESISSLIEESEKEEREAEENDQREDTTDQRVQEDHTEREMKVEKEEVPCASVDASSSFDVWLRTEVLPLDDTRPSPTTRPNDPLASVTSARLPPLARANVGLTTDSLLSSLTAQSIDRRAREERRSTMRGSVCSGSSGRGLARAGAPRQRRRRSEPRPSTAAPFPRPREVSRSSRAGAASEAWPSSRSRARAGRRGLVPLPGARRGRRRSRCSRNRPTSMRLLPLVRCEMRPASCAKEELCANCCACRLP
jgi:hypothetical protein